MESPAPGAAGPDGAPALFFRLVERGFVAVCVGAGILGLALPGPEALGLAIQPVLLLILFLACLKLPPGAVGRHLRRPLLLGWLILLTLVITPLAAYGLTLAVLPAFGAAILIMVAMPAGMMCSSLTELCGGDSALALVGTGLTTLLCPLTVPFVLWLAAVQPAAGGGAGGLSLLLRQAGWLSLFVFLPPLLAALARRTAPRPVARLRPAVSGLTVLLLALLIFVACSRCRERIGGEARLWLDGLWVLIWLFGLSAVLHLAGWFLGGGRGARERIALSINVAYMNNMLGLVFTLQFFGDRPQYILPAVLMEFPMHVWLAPLRRWGARAERNQLPMANHQ